MANAPVIKKRNGAFSVAIFAENKQRDNGQEYISYSAVVQKAYKDKNDQWQNQQISLFDNNMTDLAMLILSAYNAMVDMKNPEQKSATQPATQPAPAAQAAAPAQQDLINDDCPF